MPLCWRSQEFPVVWPQIVFLQCDWRLENSPLKAMMLMKPEESAEHHQTLTLWVGSGHETTWKIFNISMRWTDRLTHQKKVRFLRLYLGTQLFQVSCYTVMIVECVHQNNTGACGLVATYDVWSICYWANSQRKNRTKPNLSWSQTQTQLQLGSLPILCMGIYWKWYTHQMRSGDETMFKHFLRLMNRQGVWQTGCANEKQ